MVKNDLDIKKQHERSEKDGTSTEPDTSGDPKDEFRSAENSSSRSKRPLYEIRPSPSSQLMAPDCSKRRRTLDFPSCVSSAPIDEKPDGKSEDAQRPSVFPHSGSYYPSGFPMFPPFVSYTSPFLAERASFASGSSAFLDERVSVKKEIDEDKTEHSNTQPFSDGRAQVSHISNYDMLN